MAADRVTNTYEKYKKKRNVLLAFLLFPSILMIVAFVVLYTTEWIDRGLLYTIFLFLLLLNMAYIAWRQPQFALYSMYTDYSFMVNEPHPPMKVKSQLFTHDWINEMIADGYTLSKDTQRYMILYRHHKKLPNVGRSDEVLVFVIVAKSNQVDFYSEDLDRDIQAVYLTDTNFQKVNKQIALQFKKYTSLSEDVEEEIEQAIVYSAGRQRMVHLTTVYLTDTNQVYNICPSSKYPNRYVYFACKEIKRLTHTKE